MKKEIKALWGEFTEFIREDFSWIKYGYIVLYVALVCFLQMRFDIYSHLVIPWLDQGTEWLGVPLLYLLIYFGAMVPTVLLSGEGSRLRSWQAWVVPAGLVVILGVMQYSVPTVWFDDQVAHSSAERYFVSSCTTFAGRSVPQLLVLCFFTMAITGRFGLIGVKRNASYLRLYIMAFAVMLPFIIVVSRMPDFMQYYPRFKYWLADGAFGMPRWQHIAAFDLCYGLDYLNVECMFRGALVIGLTRWLGPRAVLPMMALYVAVHMGKPVAEMCSASLGGYLLGILAHRTGHLWGGIMAHLAVAFSVEVICSAWHLLGIVAVR